MMRSLLLAMLVLLTIDAAIFVLMARYLLRNDFT